MLNSGVRKKRLFVFHRGLIALIASLIFCFSFVAADLSPEIEFSKFISTLDKNNPFSISKATAKYQSLYRPIKDQTVRSQDYRQWFKFYEEVIQVQNKMTAKKNDQLLDEYTKPTVETKNWISALKYHGLTLELEEGLYYVGMDYAYLVRNFSKFLPAWHSEFNRFIAMEIKEGAISDEKVAKRTRMWENYLKKYPGTENQSLIQEKIKIYRTAMKEHLKNGKK